MNIEQTRNKSQNIFHNASLVLRLKRVCIAFHSEGSSYLFFILGRKMYHRTSEKELVDPVLFVGNYGSLTPFP